MLRFLLLTLCYCAPFIAFSQTSYISGVVNTYHRITAIAADKNSVTVDNTTGLTKGDKVMMVQMKGAAVNEVNGSNFGTVTDLKNAGNYEVGIVCRISNNTVFFVHTLASNYDVGGKVQLIKIPKYINAEVTGLLQAAPWDNLTGKGGILAISVSNTLTLKADIAADGKGFKGGTFMKSTGDCPFFLFPANGYYYNPTDLDPQNGAYKGESIADLPVAKLGGRGALANGGGGGNNHNNGGGGGSNLTAGGIGGGNVSSAGCPGSYPGQGGKALTNNANLKIYAGGGGGAGQGNNTAQTGGGSGGGIVFIEAATLKSNSHKISANGQAGSNTIGDGASGGGAGGTIIMYVNTFTDQPSIEAKGGNGGTDNEFDTPDGRCFGAGGGGSGGVIFFKGASTAGTSVLGGVRGERINTECATGSLAAAGSAGKIIPNYTYTQSTELSVLCPEGIVLPVKLIYFNVHVKDHNANLEWQISDPQDALRFIVLRKEDNDDWREERMINAQDDVTTYKATDPVAAKGRYQFRLKIIEKNGNIIYSPIRFIAVQTNVKALHVFPNPASAEITIVSDFKKGDVLKILDASGKVVYQKNIVSNQSSVHQNISFLARGVYIVQAGPLVTKFSVY